jgi:secondary thiamine-phosphate synthase enzyme
VNEFSFSTSSEIELVNITAKVAAIVGKTKAKEGAALVFAPHATGAILICEDEEGLKKDLIAHVKKMFPKGAGYAHDRIDDNAHSHLASSFLGCEQTIPVKDGKLCLGTWQSIFFLETDGPRTNRRVLVRLLKS